MQTPVVIVVMVVGSVLSLPVDRRKRWSVHTTMSEPAPHLSGQDLIDVLAGAPDIRYTDWEKRLTAVKNSQHKACFIADLDPGFNLDSSEINRILTEFVPDGIDSPSAYNAFRQRAGAYITPMCQHMDVYWINNLAPPLPRDPATRLPQPIPLAVDQPPALNGNSPPSLQSQHPQTPPPPAVYHQQQALINQGVPQTGHMIFTPSPPVVYHQLANQGSPQAGHLILTPPPLALYNQLRGLTNQGTWQTGHVILTPPPLVQWPRQL